MAVVSLSLFTLSFFNIRYDLNNLLTQTKNVRRRSPTRRVWVKRAETAACAGAYILTVTSTIKTCMAIRNFRSRSIH